MAGTFDFDPTSQEGMQTRVLAALGALLLVALAAGAAADVLPGQAPQVAKLSVGERFLGDNHSAHDGHAPVVSAEGGAGMARKLLQSAPPGPPPPVVITAVSDPTAYSIVRVKVRYTDDPAGTFSGTFTGVMAGRNAVLTSAAALYRRPLPPSSLMDRLVASLGLSGVGAALGALVVAYLLSRRLQLARSLASALWRIVRAFLSMIGGDTLADGRKWLV